MTLRTTGSCLLLASALGLAGAFPVSRAATLTSEIGASCPNPDYVAPAPEPEPFHVQILPLGDLLSKGEGNYDSVNRGYAGDTMQGFRALTGKAMDFTTVREILQMQRTWIYAVGRYQMIPVTMRYAVRHSEVSLDDRMTPETQNRLLTALVFKKRPAIGNYLRGRHDNLSYAVSELAREWAAVEYRNGRGYYDGWGGNRAKISRAEASEVLRTIKQAWQEPVGVS